MHTSAHAAPMVRELIIPQAVVRIAGKVENADYLTAHRAEQIGLNEREFIHMQGRSGILLDFSRELQGSLRIVTGYGTNGARIRIRLGESVGECLSEIGEKGSTNDHALRDVTLSLPMLSDSEYLASGFRFANVELLDEGAEVRLKAVNAVYIHSPRPQVGSFACSDETINRIYDTAAYTVQLCAQRYIWDGIKRDRLVWVGDLYPEVCALLSVCNDDGCVPDSLDFVRAETPLPGWMNNYPMYSMWWIMIVEEYYRRTGNLAWVTAQRDYFYDLLRQIDGCIAQDGDFDFGGNFVDWPTHGHADEAEGVRCLAKLCAKSARALEALYGTDGSLSARILEKLSRKDAPVAEKKQIVALKHLSGTPLSEAEKALLIEGGAAGFSTFMSYFLLSAQSDLAGEETALASLKQYYGGMLRLGATTFWEDFDLDWLKGDVCPVDRIPQPGQIDVHGDYGRFCYVGYRHSLCHGWSAGVIPFLIGRILGVTPLEAGYRKVKIAPHLGGLTFAKADIPTPQGILHVSCRAGEDGKVHTMVTAPEGVQVVS
ncbi:MAG TPA: alpha-L-rhamnosidase [Candidatus Gallimonas intestinigallinarum]|uniref:Alpha-L-rhamnosidase n=1 Tax=Candidatus Gallimonas intestinigallinarum TaxID=2838604 RepID=A0A9D2IV57_9FIRM|nr:alpha-L-rhamnosidase [Candidatus Gallimonas intestinigallinarum]